MHCSRRSLANSLNPPIKRRPVIMNDTIRIGDATKTRPTRPLRSLPNRLDSAAVWNILDQIHPESVENIKAAGKQLDVRDIDSCLEYTALSTSDKMRLKHAFALCGIISLGKPAPRLR